LMSGVRPKKKPKMYAWREARDGRQTPAKRASAWECKRRAMMSLKMTSEEGSTNQMSPAMMLRMKHVLCSRMMNRIMCVHANCPNWYMYFFFCLRGGVATARQLAATSAPAARVGARALSDMTKPTKPTQYST